MTLRLSILLLTACACYGDWNTKYLTLTHVGTVVYGDVSIDEKGSVTLLNGKTADEAAKTFWPALRARFASASVAIKAVPPRIRVEQIGFIFSGNKGEIRMSLIEKRVSWAKYDPSKSDRAFWDAVVLAYAP